MAQKLCARAALCGGLASQPATSMLPALIRQMADVIMLARVEEMLHRSAKNRESLQQFHRDWQLLREARHRLWPAPTTAGCATCDAVPFGQHAIQLNAK